MYCFIANKTSRGNLNCCVTDGQEAVDCCGVKPGEC